MIEAFKNDDVAKMVGGRFKLAALIQRRWTQILEGARPLVTRFGMTDLELIVEEIRTGMITWDSLGKSSDSEENTMPDAIDKIDDNIINETEFQTDTAGEITEPTPIIPPDTNQDENNTEKPFKISTVEKVEKITGGGPFSPDRSILL